MVAYCMQAGLNMEDVGKVCAKWPRYAWTTCKDVRIKQLQFVASASCKNCVAHLVHAGWWSGSEMKGLDVRPKTTLISESIPYIKHNAPSNTMLTGLCVDGMQLDQH